MYYTIINFPFSSINEEEYVLALCLNDNDGAVRISNFMARERRLFKQGIGSSDGTDTVFVWEGTLTGQVRATDDERENMWEPLVCSKLSFNMAVSEFPDCLMDYCTNNRAKVILYAYDDKGTKHEMWRGYLVAQTLDMTVVNDLLSVPLVAVDEVAMAKYMDFKSTLEYVTNDKWNTIFGLMEHYHTLHHTRGLTSVTTGFEKLYEIIGLNHSNRLMWHRNMRVANDSGTLVNDLPNMLVVNLDRWLQPDEQGKVETTWEEVLTEIFEYLGMTFAVGSYMSSTVNDWYLLACPTDPATVDQFVYTFDNHSTTTVSTDQYLTLSNPTKVGANLQITAEPDKYNKVVVQSTPERWKTHQYLTDEHYKPIVEGAAVRYEWGVKPYQSGAGQFSDYGFHKLIYLKPDSKEDPYLDIPDCALGEGYLMARSGILPVDDINSCDGLTEPDDTCVTSLDFITMMEGCCCVKIGNGQIGGIDEDTLLTPYFILLNGMWENMYEEKDYTMQNTHLGDTPWLKLTPLADNGAVHPSEKHYLKAEFNMMFIRENFPTVLDSSHGLSQTYLFLKAVDQYTACLPVDWRTPAMILPQDTTLADLTLGNNLVDPSIDLWYDLYFKAYIRIGDYYYNGSAWVYVAPNSTPPTCDVTLWSDTNEIKWVTDPGQYVIGTKNYYFTISNPYRGSNVVDRYSNHTKMLTSLQNISVHGQPVHGQLEMQILGQVRFQSTTDGSGNSIPFILLKGIDINYTDNAELMSQEIDNKVELTIDANSHTKKPLEKTIAMATPSVDGFFNNAIVYDGGEYWHNLTKVRHQTTADILTPEYMIAHRLTNQYGSGQLFVELETPVLWDTNVHNVCFKVNNLTETDGVFLPVKRVFDYTKQTMRVKLQRVNGLA